MHVVGYCSQPNQSITIKCTVKAYHIAGIVHLKRVLNFHLIGEYSRGGSYVYMSIVVL